NAFVLTAFLATGDAALVRKLLLLDAKTRAVLAKLPADTLTALADNQSEAELTWLANYLAEREAAAEGNADVIAQIASGAITVEQLRNPPLVAASEAAAPAPASTSAETGNTAPSPSNPWGLIPGSGV